MMCTHVHCNIIGGSQKVEGTQVSTHRWMDKQKCGTHTHNGLLVILKKEGDSDTGYNMDEF